MAAGIRKKFELDLSDILDFPDGSVVPAFAPEPGPKSWMFLLQITQNAPSPLRPVLHARCKKNVPFVIAFCTSNPSKDMENLKDCKPGNVMCITSARPKQFVDGSAGIWLENPEDVLCLPVSLERLYELNDGLRKRSDDGLIECCLNCDKQCLQQCTRCRSRYCSTECMRIDWPNHKPKCKALSALHKWNKTDRYYEKVYQLCKDVMFMPR